MLLLVLACTARAQEYRLVPVVPTGLTQPVYIAQPPGDPRALYIVELAGTIRVARDGVLQSSPWLDLRSKVSSGGEKGLLGLAFHPGFATNGRFFVNYTTGPDTALRTVVSELSYASPSQTVDPASERELLTFSQPFTNHNGGCLQFGPDGKLYIASGDGGSGGDPQGNGQNLNTLLGKLLRLDVDGAQPYESPPDNPFFGQAGRRAEIWAYGLRNPWRFSFDRLTGLLYCGDVGQSRIEEIDVISRGDNLGWDVLEGSLCFEPSSGCDRTGKVSPIFEYGRTIGQSITGGYVYRGSRLPELRGSYVYGDFVSKRVFALRYQQGTVSEARQILTAAQGISSFGEDSAGEIYVAGFASGTGSVSRLDYLSASVAVGEGVDFVSLPLRPATSAPFTVEHLAAQVNSPFVAWTEQGVFRLWMPSLGITPPVVESWRGYAIAGSARSFGNSGPVWPAASFDVALPAGLNLVSIPPSVAATRTTADLLTLTGSPFVYGGGAVHLAADTPAPLAAGRGYLVSLPAARTIDLLSFER